jgi:hypothetical protein
MWIATIIIGTFIRGPGWYLFLPGEYWDVHKTVAITNVDWPHIFGIYDFWPACIFGGVSTAAFLFGIPAVYWKARVKKSPTLQKLGAVRYWIVALFVMSTAGVVVKMVMRLAFNVKYIMVGPMGFNI